ncbi:CheR family methyltransferase [Saccharospirillum salsuginis]|uniref:protein-glutamate O-methyltransferase n=1 Tax=Saccharospirillum salsuginis TaxID=418750 RepID=A0A918N645_9GAMM|nr:CheR family methyltransferase [Saccharospirillum salsuginis]GGX44303.1 methyltransferase PilK [Saccharospirillum salsuginis]
MSTERVSVSQAPDLSDRAFTTWQDLLEERLGLQLPEQRRSFLKTSLSIRMRELGFDDYLDYYRYVRSGDAGLVEWNILIDRVTVQETRFFRDPAAFALTKDFLQRRAREGERPLSLWSVGCSTGEETYSLAMMTFDLLRKEGEQGVRRFGVTGTDVSRRALETARAGAYPSRRLENLDSRLVERFFTRENDRYRINDELKDRVCFTRLNVLELARSPMANLDLIYCQNVLIYFRKWRRKEIVTELARRLAPGGMLVLGLGEVVDWKMPELTRVPGERALAYLKHK